MHSRRCSQCNTSYSLADRYCKSCGADISDRISEPSYVEHSNNQPSKPGWSPWKKRGLGILVSIWIVIAIVVVLSITIGNSGPADHEGSILKVSELTCEDISTYVAKMSEDGGSPEVPWIHRMYDIKEWQRTKDHLLCLGTGEMRHGNLDGDTRFYSDYEIEFGYRLESSDQAWIAYKGRDPDGQASALPPETIPISPLRSLSDIPPTK